MPETIALGRTRSGLIKLAITVILPLLLFLIPTTEVFTPTLRLFFVITLIAILAFATDSLPQSGVALSLPVLYVIFQICPPDAAFRPWSTFIPWMCIGGLILAHILDKIGFLQRLAYRCILITGASYKGIIWGLTLTGVVLNLMIPAQAVIPMAALSYGICKAMDLKVGKASAGITLAAAMGSLLPLNWLYNSNLLIVLGFGTAGGGPKSIGWFEVFQYNFPMILHSIIMAFMCTIVFRPDEEIHGKSYFQKELSRMGKMSTAEWKGLIITLLLIFILMFGRKIFPNLEVAWAFLFVPMLFFLPGIDLGSQKDINSLNWGFIFFVTSCLAIGNAAGHLGLGKLIAQMALPFLSGQGYYTFFIFIWVLFMLMNFLLTPLAMEAAFTTPLVEIALQLGIDPKLVYYIILNGADQVLLPYEYALYLIFFSFGMIKVGDFAKIMGIKMVINFAIVFALLVPFWNLMNFIYT